MDKQELKLCPFCGSTAHVGISDCEMGRRRYMAYAECDNMDCAMIATELFEDESQARQKVIEMWNRRVNNG